MSTIAIMQPYVFPYIGYFHLIDASEEFVFFNDVNFIKRGWINRNRIVLNKSEFKFNVPLIKASQNKLISETKVSYQDTWADKLLKSIEVGYKRALYFEDFMPVVEDVINSGRTNLDELCVYSIDACINYFEICQETKILLSSDLGIDYKEMSGQDKIISICKNRDANNYVNASGGKELYDKSKFSKEGINLGFINSKFDEYNQFTSEFMPGMSIIDMGMHCSKQEIQSAVKNYSVDFV